MAISPIVARHVSVLLAELIDVHDSTLRLCQSMMATRYVHTGGSLINAGYSGNSVTVKGGISLIAAGLVVGVLSEVRLGYYLVSNWFRPAFHRMIHHFGRAAAFSFAPLASNESTNQSLNDSS